MKATYVYHDCFIIETASNTIIFDYWKDPLAKAEEKKFPPILKTLDRRKNIYVVVSHHHKDHFTRKIFMWQQEFPGIKYVVSPDVYKSMEYMFREGTTYQGYCPEKGSVWVISKGERYEDSHIRIDAFGSTDTGNSYALVSDGWKIFHAGDLNAWVWIDESTPQEVEESMREFTEIVGEIKKEYPHFDIAMFPVDSRMGRGYEMGAEYFLEHIKVDIFIPMHFMLYESQEEKERRLRDVDAFQQTALKHADRYEFLKETREYLEIEP